MNRFALVAIWLLCLLAAIVGLAWMACAIVSGSARARRIAVGFDIVGNVTAGGDQNETISARCWRYRNEMPYRTLRRIIDAAFALNGDREHCERTYLEELINAQRRVQR